MKKENHSRGFMINQLLVSGIVVMFIALGGIVTYSNKLYGEGIKVDTFNYATLDNYSNENSKIEILSKDNLEEGEENLVAIRFEQLKSEIVTELNTTEEDIESEVEKSSRAYIPESFGRVNFENTISRSSYTINRIREQFLDLDVINSYEEFSGDILDDEPYIDEDLEGENIVIDGVPTNYVKTIDMNATAYCLCKKCCGKSENSPGYGATASGLRIIPNTGMKVIAVDPKVIPLGTKVYVQGLNGAGDYGYAIAADTGGAIKSNKIDLYYDTHTQALKWGRKKVRVYILQPDDPNVESIF